MKKNLEVKWNELKTSYQSADFQIHNTDDLEMQGQLLLQKEAVEMLAFALQLKGKGYNIYLSGADELSLYHMTLEQVMAVAAKENVADDICYIYNFEKPSEPKCIRMQAGDGKQFQDDMKELRHFLIEELTEKLESQVIDEKREKIVLELDEKKDAIADELEEKVIKLGFKVALTKDSIGFIPVDETGEAMAEIAYESLEEDQKDAIQKDAEALYTLAGDAWKQIKAVEKEYEYMLADLEEAFVIDAVSYYMGYLKKRYEGYACITAYVNDIMSDLLENIDVFHTKGGDEVAYVAQLIPWIETKGVKDVVDRYDINVLVDNGSTVGAPVITSQSLSYSELIGKVKVKTEMGGSHTDFMEIYPGLFHKADGGYMILYMTDIVEAVGAWEVIKKVLKTEQVIIESLGSGISTTTVGMTPSNTKIKTKVIVIGSYEIYNLLVAYDTQFKQLFKMHINFAEELDATKANIQTFVKCIQDFCAKENLPPVTREGLVKLIEYSHRYAGSKNKLSTVIQPLQELVREASIFAEASITEEHLSKTLRIKNLFKETIQRSIDEKYRKEILLIDVACKRIGQINGLAVYSMDDFEFGKPVRITATTYKGKAGLIDVESAVGLSGTIHTKGVQIISGFLGHHFAKVHPLSLCCRICFEQSYGCIDGDSASVAELFAVLSSIGDIPIRQGVAVTGSINQYGEIQPIGGVNEKIEGFFRVCKEKGLTGQQGVIIPYQNKEDLMPEDDVIEAVKNNQFHIYAISSFKEGISILSTLPYKEVETQIKTKLKAYRSQELVKKKIKTK